MKKKPKKDSLTAYLRKYYSFQSKILLCYHPDNNSYWNDRAWFLGENYNPNKKYNHRGILYNEIVVEFDEDNKEKNEEYAREVGRRLQQDNISYSLWYSGNKSTHLHCFLEVGAVKNIQLLKKCFMRHYCDGLPLPDLRLAVENHLVRGEWGVHEKSGKRKSLLFKYRDYPRASPIPEAVWKRYYNEMARLVQRRVTTDVQDLSDHPGLKYILSTHFKDAGDGRERALFMLVHLLKKKYTDEAELTKYLQEWYRYSSSKQGMTDEQVRRKVHYHYNRDYTITEKYLNELLESLGKTELIRSDIDGKSNNGMDRRIEDYS